MRMAWLHRIVVIGSALLFSAGCATVQRYPVVPIRVQLVSPTPFMVHVRARGDTAATFCEVLRLSGTIAEVRGDTMEFAAVRNERRPYPAADCLEGRPGYVVLSTAPDLRAVTTNGMPPVRVRDALFVATVFTAVMMYAMYKVNGPP